jgi:DNA-binding Xre family transcriptional regulator
MTYSSLSKKSFILTLSIKMAQIRDTKLLQRIALVAKKLREDKELTQEDVYNDTNIHIGRIETAKANLSVSTLSALCKYYKVKVSEFLKMVESI